MLTRAVLFPDLLVPTSRSSEGAVRWGRLLDLVGRRWKELDLAHRRFTFRGRTAGVIEKNESGT